MSVTKIRISQTQVDFKDAVVAVLESNISLAGGAPDTVDGVSLAVGDRVLVNGQTTASENGIYVVTTLGTGSDGTWERVEDMYAGDKIHKGLVVLVSGGTVNGKKAFMLISSGVGGVHTVGTTDQAYESLADANTGVTLDEHVYNEVMTGTIDHSNKVFTTAVNFATGKLRVYLNGVRQILGDDYTVTGANEITMTFAPRSAPGNPDILTCDYLV